MSTLQQHPHSPSPSPPSPLKRKNMSITQTYFLAHTARGKLSSEASRSDHNLRLLVGHANLLDSLMLELAEAEREQESWFNQSVRKASKPVEQRHVQWADAVVDDGDSSDSSESDSDYSSDDEIERFEDDGAEDYDDLALTLTPSHNASPPELEHDDSEDLSDDDSLPPSPPADVLPSFSEKQRQQIATTGFYPTSPSSSSIPAEQEEDDFFLPQRAAPGLISAITVY